MAASEITYALIAERIGALPGLVEKPMFGGICFMLNGNMICGAMKRGAIIRVGKEAQSEALTLPGVEKAVMGGRIMTGFVILPEAAIAEDEAVLTELVDRALGFVRGLAPK